MVISLDQVGRVLFAGTEDGIFHKDLTSDADWTRLGLAGIRVSDIYIDPITSDTIYCAIDIRDFPDDLPTVSVYKTTDGGTTWNSADSGLPTERINTIEGRPDNPRVLYATVDVDSSSTSTPPLSFRGRRCLVDRHTRSDGPSYHGYHLPKRSNRALCKR